MASKGLFQKCTWDVPVPEPFASLPIRNTSVYSDYAKSVSTPRSTLHAPTINAIMEYIRIVSASADVDDGPKPLGALGSQNDNYLIGEYVTEGGNLECSVFIKETGSFVACSMTDPASSPQTYILGDKKNDGSGLIFTLMPLLMLNDEFADNMRILMTELAEFDAEADTELTAEATNAMYVLCDNAYRRIETPSVCSDAAIRVNIPESGNIPLLTAMTISNGIYSPTEVLFGNFTVIKPGTGAVKSKDVFLTNEEFEGKFKLTEREFTVAEEMLIPKLEPWYIIPPEVVKVCNHAKKTTGSVIPMRNFMLRGPSGTGKTEGARAIAAGLGLPYMHLTCGADDEKFDFVGQILPEFKEDTEKAVMDMVSELPTMADCEADPTDVYFKLTGEFETDVSIETAKSVLQEKLDEISAYKKDKADSSGPSYRYIKTQLITAMEKGYLIEIQEPSVILKAGVLVSLNSLFDTSSSSIQLMTGEVIHRHPDAVVVITTNTNYEGCRLMNQSVISRMNLVIDMDKIEPHVMAERALRITGCENKTMVNKMAQVIYDIDDTYRDSMDGVCGMRELISWVQSFMICEDAIEAAKDTVISSFSANRESRAELTSGFIASNFAA